MTFVSYAQNYEDVMLWRALGAVEQGRYLDIGAQDPIHDSVSLAFYEAGWRGVHVEPTAMYSSRLRQARPDDRVIEAAVTDAAGPIEFFEIAETGLSTGRSDVAQHHRESGWVTRKALVPCVRLDSLLELESDDFHWMKIDVEGMEADALRSWGECKRRPWVVVVESTFPVTRKTTENLWIHELLTRKYREVYFDGLSRYFLHEKHEDLASHFALPPNMFDAFVVATGHFSTKDLIASFVTKLDDERASGARLTDELEGARSGAAQLASELQSAHTHREDAVAARDAAAEESRQAREREAAAVAQMIAAEEAHRQSVERLWHDRNAAEEEIRRAARELEQRLRDELTESTKRAETERGLLNKHIGWLQGRLDEQAESVRRVEREAGLLHKHIAWLQECHDEQGERAERAKLAAEAMLHTQAESLAQAEKRISDFIGARASWRNRFAKILGLRRSDAYRQLAQWRPQISFPQQLASGSQAHHSEVRRDPMRFSPPNGNPYLRANSLAELLSWDDVDFVRCAYVTVLGRQPDPEGEAVFTRFIRRGGSKPDLLWRLRRSPEGGSHDPGIAGFDRALARAAWGRTPVIGPVIRLFTRTEGNSRAERRHRSLLNQLAILHIEQSAQRRLLDALLDATTSLQIAAPPPAEQIEASVGADDCAGSHRAAGAVAEQRLGSRERFVLDLVERFA